MFETREQKWLVAYIVWLAPCVALSVIATLTLPSPSQRSGTAMMAVVHVFDMLLLSAHLPIAAAVGEGAERARGLMSMCDSFNVVLLICLLLSFADIGVVDVQAAHAGLLASLLAARLAVRT